MKHSEIYDKHADRRKGGKQKKRMNEGGDNWDRHARVSFKNFVREIRHADLEADLDDLEADLDDETDLNA